MDKVNSTERLTTRNEMGVAVLKQPRMCDRCDEPIYRLSDYGDGDPIERLAEYEELEELGRLLKLPCAVGDIIYIVLCNHEIAERKVVRFKMIAKGWAAEVSDWFYLFEEFGKNVFLTREEAEAALKL